MRYIFSLVGLVLIGFAALKTYMVFHRPKFGPEMMADATMAALGGIVCFAIAAKMKRRQSAKQ